MRTIRFSGPVALAAGAADRPPKLVIVGYTGGVMRVEGYGPVVLDLAGLELPPGIPVLADHDATLDGVIGAGTPTTDGRQLLVSATLADTPAAAKVRSILEGGVALQASLGADPTDRRPVGDRETATVNGRTLTGPFALVTAARLRELSVLPLGADADTSVSLAARAAKGSAMKFKAMLRAAKAAGDDAATKYSDEQIDEMTEEEAKAALKKCMRGADADPDDPDDGEKPASASALLRIMAGMPDALKARAAAEGWGERRCTAEALHHLRSSRPAPSPGVPAGHHAADESVILAGIMMRAGHEATAVKALGERAAQAARDAGLHRAPFADIFAAHLRCHGIDPGPRRDIEGMIRASGPSTASLGNLLSNVLNKLLESQWFQSTGTWRSWCAVRPTNDFKPGKALRPVFGGNLSVLGPTGAIEHGSLTDFMISYQVYEFAKMFTISRQTMINDDLSGMAELPTGLVLMADRAVSDLVYATLMSNPGGFFAAGNGNDQSGAPSALSSASLTTAIKQLRKQRGPNGAILNIPPATLIVGPDLEQTAKELLHSAFQFRDQTADRQQAGNPLQNVVNLVVEPRLALGCTNPLTQAAVAGSATLWYLFSEPTWLPGIVAFLRGAEAPTVQASDPLGFNFDQPGQSWRCLYDFGFALGDFRAAQRSAGA